MKSLMSLLVPLIAVAGTAAPIKVVVWDEQQPAQKQAYPNFLGNQIASYLQSVPNLSVKSVSLDEPEQGLSDAVLDDCRVLIWWGHARHGDVKSEKVRKVVERVKDGKMGLIVLHSAHWSLPFVEAMNERTRQDVARSIGKENITIQYVTPEHKAPKPDDPLTPNTIFETNSAGMRIAKVTLPKCVFPSWRADAAPSHVTTLLSNHPIARDVPLHFDISHTEMYNEPFHVPPPYAVIF